MSAFKLVMRTATGVPAGAYEGELVGVEQVVNDYGDGIKWSWKITKGTHAGRVAGRITGNSPSPQNACGKMMNAVAGGTLADGQEFDPSDYIGRKYTVIVSAGEKGGTKVETVAASV